MIDLRSDTVTMPDAAMRQAMAEAEVGDDVYGEDPTMNRLQALAAEMFGKPAALWLPSGTMANLVALLSQTRPGDTIILSEGAHPFHYENANVAMVGGLLTRTVPDRLCKMTAAQVAEQIVQIDDPHFSPTTLAAIENTTNRGGGAYYTVDEVAEIGALCRKRGLRIHCDGARFFNACIAAGVAPAGYARHCDTVCFCLSKGLGAPAGSILVGDEATIRQARRYRKMLGGGMRQVGVLAAAGLFALKHNIEGLREDHRRAACFRERVEAAGVVFPFPSPTNILYFEVKDGPRFVAGLAQAGVRVLEHDPNLVRAVFHRDIDDAALDQAVDATLDLLRKVN